MNNPTRNFIIVHSEGAPFITNEHRFAIVNRYHRFLWNFKSSLGYYCGYHRFCEKDGTAIDARADSDEGAHTKGYNSISLGYCFAGNGDKEIPTNEQINDFKKWAYQKMREYSIPPDHVVPHRYFLQHREKTCYGALLADNWAARLVSLIPVAVTPQIPQRKTLLDLLAQLTNLQRLLDLYRQRSLGAIDDRDHAE